MVPHKGNVIKLWQFLQKNKMASIGSLSNGCATIGRSQRDMPRDKSELEAESKQNPPDLENSFNMDGCAIVQYRR
jgi:hypothetical protein